MSDPQQNPTGLFSGVLEQIKEISQTNDTENPQGGPVAFTDKDEVVPDPVKHRKQAIILSEDALKLYSQGLLYVTEEKNFYERSSSGTYAAIKDDHLRDKLKQKYQLSSNSNDPKILSPQKQVMVYIHDKQRCQKAIPSLAGYLAGAHNIGSEKVLVKSNLSLMLPIRRTYDTIMDLLIHVFGNEEPYCQLDRFLTWLQSAYFNAYEIYVNKKDINDVRLTGLALIVCGPSQVGKTFLINQITKIFGGVVGQPFKSMTGRTEFNADCSRAIHLSVDDQTGTRTYEQRKEHGQNLKAVLSGSAQWVQAKHMDAFTVPLYQRLTYSFNTDRDSFSTFPALSDGVRERILALLVNSQKWERFQKVEDYKVINQTITYELPGLLYYLMNEYAPPERCIWSSFGCSE